MSDRGQATIEAMAVVPACLLAALALVDSGLLMRDRIAVSHAASRAGVAQLESRDARAAARSALPASLRDGVRVRVAGGSLEVSTDSDVRLLGLAGAGRVASSVELEEEGAR